MTNPPEDHRRSDNGEWNLVPNEPHTDKARERRSRHVKIPLSQQRIQQRLTSWQEQPPKPEKQQYPQDWKAYDAAKTNEDLLFKELLIDLTLVTNQARTKQPGRIGYLQWEKIVCMAIKAYYKGDLRKTESILKSLAKAKVIPRVPDYTTISTFYNDEKLTPILEELIKVSARPLSMIEQVGAIDSTGFSTSRYACWNEYKWGKHEGKERIWIKLHAAVGTRTNVIVSAKITEKNVADIKMLQPVLGNTTTYFNMQEFVADKAYVSRDILNFLEQLGLDPYIPFKSNSIGTSKGSRIWREMFDHFHTSREIFDEHYHQRSNVETVFHMLKQRFSSHLMTRKFVANANETLIRCLCHNLCVLIQEAHESGIQVDFAACREMAPLVEKPL